MASVDIVFASGPTYKSGSNNFLIPFSYTNGKLDIPSINTEAYPSDTSGTALGNAGASVRLMGGSYNVTSLGINLQNFIKARTWDGYTVTGTAASIVIKSTPVLTRVQQLSSKYLAPTWDQKSYNVTPNAWDNANFIGNSTVYLFTKPLVVQVNGSKDGYSGPICITIQTSWDH